jgi:hypothetical protein
MIPVSALIFRSEGLRVATVVNNNKAHLVAISMGEDDGKFVQITGGLDENSRVIENPPDSVIEGETVSVVQRQNTNQQGGAAAPQPAGEQKK